MKHTAILFLLLVLIGQVAGLSYLAINTSIISTNVTYTFNFQYNLTNTSRFSSTSNWISLDQTHVLNFTPSTGTCNVTLENLDSLQYDWNITCSNTSATYTLIIENVTWTHVRISENSLVYSDFTLSSQKLTITGDASTAKRYVVMKMAGGASGGFLVVTGVLLALGAGGAVAIRFLRGRRRR